MPKQTPENTIIFVVPKWDILDNNGPFGTTGVAWDVLESEGAYPIFADNATEDDEKRRFRPTSSARRISRSQNVANVS